MALGACGTSLALDSDVAPSVFPDIRFSSVIQRVLITREIYTVGRRGLSQRRWYDVHVKSQDMMCERTGLGDLHLWACGLLWALRDMYETVSLDCLIQTALLSCRFDMATALRYLLVILTPTTMMDWML